MKKAFITTIALLAVVSLSFAQSENVVFETIYLDPKTDHLKEVGDNIKAHNEKYHAEMPYTASAWSTLTGEHSGQILWIMGPFTFADLDNRPSEGGHDDDWAENVMPHVNGMHNGAYWRRFNDIGYMPSENYQGKIMRVRFITLKEGKWDEYEHLLSGINKVYQENSFTHSFAMYGNWSNTKVGDIAIVWQYDNYAYFDQDLEFVKKYEEVFGENSWNMFLEAWRDYVKDANDVMYERMD